MEKRRGLRGSAVILGVGIAILGGLVPPACGRPQAFGPDFPKLDSKATGEWWTIKKGGLWVPRHDVVAFALYTHDAGILKLSAQLRE